MSSPRGIEPAPRRVGVPLDPATLKELKRRYLAGEKYEVIISETGLSDTTIKKYARRLQLPQRKPHLTPEGRVKNRISRLLDQYNAYRYMPVPQGYGPTTVDYLVCYKGKFVGIEAKSPNGKVTSLQRNVLERIQAAGGKTFVIRGDDGLRELEQWLSGG